MAAVIAPTPAFDWAVPNYSPILASRVERLRRFRAATPREQAAVRAHYAAHPEAFLNDWACVLEPRNAARGLATVIPMVLWPKQIELVQWITERWRRGESGVLLKSRDSGASWLTVALGATLCLFYPGTVVGYGSRKVEYVDGTPKSLFAKARHFLSRLPPEFLGGFNLDRHATFMKLLFPNGSAMTGEGGTQLGRGDRTSLHFVDEAAFLENEEEVDAALSQATRCRIDVSTPHGRTGSFAEKFFSGKVPTFVFSWRDDPRKDQAWYDAQVATLPPVVLAQEVNADFNASVEGIVIPRIWADAAVDADIKLGIKVTGMKYAGFDLADTGDRCALALRHGILVTHLESWSGAGSNLFASTVRAFNILDEHGWDNFHFDNDGLGSACTGDAEQINQRRLAAGQPLIRAEGYRGSGAVCDPTGELVPGRKNEDFFLNAKAQAWWHVRRKFEATYRAVVLGQRPFDPDALISLPSDLPELNDLLVELSWPTFSLNQAGKVLIQKYDGGRSPDRADAVVIAFQPGTGWLEVWTKL
jgi:phage terminase large subunit